MIYRILYWLAVVTAWLPLDVCWFCRKTYYEDKSVQSKKVKGPAMVISNHFHVLDYGVLLFTFLPRRLHVIASEFAYRFKFTAWGMKAFGGIEVDRRKKDLSFMDAAIRTMKEGHLVLIFPEGQSNDDKGPMMPFKPSYVMMAVRAGVPVLPVITDGNFGLFRRLRVVIGKPIDVRSMCAGTTPTREEMLAINTAVEEKCHELYAMIEEKSKKGGKCQK